MNRFEEALSMVIVKAKANRALLWDNMAAQGVVWPDPALQLQVLDAAVVSMSWAMFPDYAARAIPAITSKRYGLDGSLVSSTAEPPQVILFMLHPILLGVRVRLLLCRRGSTRWKRAVARLSDIVGHEAAHLAGAASSEDLARAVGVAWGRLWDPTWRQ